MLKAMMMSIQTHNAYTYSASDVLQVLHFLRSLTNKQNISKLLIPNIPYKLVQTISEFSQTWNFKKWYRCREQTIAMQQISEWLNFQFLTGRVYQTRSSFGYLESYSNISAILKRDFNDVLCTLSKNCNLLAANKDTTLTTRKHTRAVVCMKAPGNETKADINWHLTANMRLPIDG